VPSIPATGVGADLGISQHFEQGVHIRQLYPAPGKDHDVLVRSDSLLGEDGSQFLYGFRIAVAVQRIVPVDVNGAGDTPYAIVGC
jgi:hypothetical protein